MHFHTIPNSLGINLSHQMLTHRPPRPSTQLLGIDAKNVITCMSCKAVREKENMTHIVEMVYTRQVGLLTHKLTIYSDHEQMVSNEGPSSVDFSTTLRNSLLRQMTHKATCQTCKQFSTFSSRRSIPTRDLPPILAINTSIYNQDNFQVWHDSRNQTFLKAQVEIHGQIEGMDDPETVLYDLRVLYCGIEPSPGHSKHLQAMVVQIVSKEKKSHLVSIVKGRCTTLL
jgi:hypothetical protein